MKFVRSLNVFLSIIGGYVLLGLSFLIVFEVIARKLFDFSLPGVDEIGGYVVTITGTFGFAYALIERTHTRIDIVFRPCTFLATQLTQRTRLWVGHGGLRLHAALRL